jgi:Uma2 family endonuclease
MTSIPQHSTQTWTKGNLPTMYDLPSEDPEEPGLPDEFHCFQPQLLSRTLQLAQYSRQEIFYASDMNLYYDLEHLNWYKRPDWFLVVGVPRRYRNSAPYRQSYVLWDEQVPPIVVMEFLSPGTEAEDLGRFADRPLQPRAANKPPHKFEVYEKIVQVQNYIVYDEETEHLRYFRLIEGTYQEQPVANTNPRLWIPELEMGLAIVPGEFNNISPSWLRWCDATGQPFLTDTEQAIAEEAEARQRETEARQQETLLQSQVQQTIKNLLAIDMSISQIAQVTGVSETEIQQLQQNSEQ